MEIEQKKSLSQEDIDFIVDLVEKYNLGPTDLFSPEMKEILKKAKSKEEVAKIIENLPFNKIMDRIKEILKGKISSEELASLLRKDLGISFFRAEKIAKEIRENVLKEKEEIKNKEPLKKVTRDIYREPIE